MVACPMPVADRRAWVTRALAALLGLHGIGHFARLRDWVDRAAGEAVEYLGGLWTVTEASMLRITGGLWVCVGVAMLVAAVALWRRLARTREIVVAVALASLVLGVFGPLAAVDGVVISAVGAPERVGMR